MVNLQNIDRASATAQAAYMTVASMVSASAGNFSNLNPTRSLYADIVWRGRYYVVSLYYIDSNTGSRCNVDTWYPSTNPAPDTPLPDEALPLTRIRQGGLQAHDAERVRDLMLKEFSVSTELVAQQDAPSHLVELEASTAPCTGQPWQLDAGRVLMNHGKPVACVGRIMPVSPVETDALARRIVQLLNLFGLED